MTTFPSALKYFILSVSAILLAVITLSASGGKTVIRSTIGELDKVLESKALYEKEKTEHIDSLKEQAKGKSGFELYEIYWQLYLAYELYNFDSAYMYMNEMRAIAAADGDTEKVTDCDLSLAFCCVSAGLFFEANDILEQVKTRNLNKWSRRQLYSVLAKLYFDMARSIQTEPHFSLYNEKSIEYSEHVIGTYTDGDPEILPHLANIYRCRQDYPMAASTINSYLELTNPDQRGLTLCAGGLGEFCLMMGDTTNAVAYLSYAAIGDTKAVTKETPGLSLIADVVYRRGDVERAFRYANIAMEDANFYNARHRKIEVANVLPIIDSSRYALIEKQKNFFLLNTVLLSSLLLLAIISGAVIIRQIKQLKAARIMIQEQNEELKKTNDKLLEANRVKEDYIGYLFRLNSAYMDELEKLRKFVRRKLMARQYDDLLNIISRTDIKKERESKLASFDDIVLKLFPDFVDQFNALFRENDRFLPEPERSLTPEMRIFALIRLGINDSEDIARILNYSVNTINTYKTKAKNRSQIPNEKFEKAVRAFLSHKK